MALNLPEVTTRDRRRFRGLFLGVRSIGWRPQKSLQVSLQFCAVFLAQVGKLEGLQAALGGPHGEQHRCFAAYGAAAYVKHDFSFDALVQRGFEMEQTASSGKLM